MDSQNSPQATPQDLDKARLLLSQAGLYSPGIRLMAESVIASKFQSAVSQLIQMLEDLVREKEAAYADYKTQIGETAKDLDPEAVRQYARGIARNEKVFEYLESLN